MNIEAVAGQRSTPADPAGSRLRAGTVLTLVVVVMMINWADKSALGVVSVPLMRDLGIGPADFGLLGSAYFFTYSASAILFGWIATRVAVNRLLLLVTLLWAACMLPVALAPGFLVILLGRIGLGFAESPATPLGNFLVQSWYPDERRTLPTTLVMIGSPLGVLLAGPGLTTVMVHLGWQAVFASLAVVGLVWCVFWSVLGGEGRFSGRPPSGAALSWRQATAGFRVLVTNRSWVLCTVVAFAAYWTITLSTTWMAAFFTTALGFSVASTGWLIAVAPGVSIVAMLVWAGAATFLARRGVSTRWSRGVLVGATSLAGGALVTAGALVGSPATVVTLVAIGTALAQPIFPIGFVIAAQVAPPAVRALSVSLYAALATLAGVVAPAVTGALVGSAGIAGYHRAFLLAGVLSLVAGIVGALRIDPARDPAKDVVRAEHPGTTS